MRRKWLLLALILAQACASASKSVPISVPSRAPLPTSPPAPAPMPEATPRSPSGARAPLQEAAPAPGTSPAGGGPDAIVSVGLELVETEAALLGLLRAKPPVDCVRACTLYSNMEQIAARMCALAETLPQSAASGTCADARRRTESAHTALSTACTCPAAPPAPPRPRPTR